MIVYFISIPVMMLLTVLQSTAISRLTLISGSADLVLLAVAAWGIRERGYTVFVWALVGSLFTTLVTAMPFYIPLASYMFVAILAQLLFGRIWQSPIFMMILVVFAGTFFQHAISILYLQFSGIEAGFMYGLRNFTLPSLLLNFFFIFPMFVLINDLRRWLLPEEDYE